MAEDLIGYDKLTQDAGRSVVRAALMRAISPTGLPGRHHFYITFRTTFPGVLIPEHVAARYPDDMTIVLEHQFWDLEVFSDRFRVIVKFGGQPHPVVIPFAAVVRFYDPYVRFGLQFDPGAHGDSAGSIQDDLIADPVSPVEDTAPAAAAGGGAVVSLDAFRKK